MEKTDSDGPVDRDPTTGQFAPGNQAAKGRPRSNFRQRVEAVGNECIDDMISDMRRGNRMARQLIFKALVGNAREARPADGNSEVPFQFRTPNSTAEARQLLSDIAFAVISGTIDPEQGRVATSAISAWLDSHETHKLQVEHDELKREVSAITGRRS